MQKSEIHRYAMRLAFHGAPFSGWQIQTRQRTVQGELTNALRSLTKEDTNIIGAGRTDAGVHGKNYVAHFDVLNEFDCQELSFKLNRFLPDRISVYEIKKADIDFHARFSALSRSYSYTLREKKHAFGNDLVCNYTRELDFEILKSCSELVKNAKNFSAFEKKGSDNTNSICEIYHSLWIRKDNSIIFQVRANRFLRNMVRSLVGTMLETANGKRDFNDWQSLLKGGERSDSGNSAPAHGLVFMGVNYSKSPFDGRETAKY